MDFVHMIHEARVASNVKCISFTLIAVLLMNISPAAPYQLFRLPKTLFVFNSPGRFFFDTTAKDQPFKVYWNSPTFQCKPHGILFNNLTEYYGISQNKDDEFRGDILDLLYDPGKFPALLQGPNQNDYFYRNGGVPQEGSIKEHLDEFSKQLDELIPDEGFNGLGVIDFESWRPIYRQNFGSLTPYKDVSYRIERENHPFWPPNWVEKEATRRFEEAGKVFMEETLKLAKAMRPFTRWGYYAYPYCFNMNGNNKQPDCSDTVRKENDRIQWLWDNTDVMFPSVYLPKNRLTPGERIQLIKGRMVEAQRLSSKTNGNPPFIAYLWYKYQDQRDEFLSLEDLYNAVDTIKKYGAAGVVIWGSSNDVNSKDNCNQLKSYVENVLGPVINEFVSK